MFVNVSSVSYTHLDVYKRQPLSVTNGIGIEEHDQEGRVITAEYDNFYLVCCYTPNSQRELARLEMCIRDRINIVGNNNIDGIKISPSEYYIITKDLKRK